MKRILGGIFIGGLLIGLSACSEQRAKLADLFRWGTKPAAIPFARQDPKLAEDLDMSKMTLESLQREGIKIVEISPDSIFVSPERQQISGIRFGQVRRAEYGDGHPDRGKTSN